MRERDEIAQVISSDILRGVIFKLARQIARKAFITEQMQVVDHDEEENKAIGTIEDTLQSLASPRTE